MLLYIATGENKPRRQVDTNGRKAILAENLTRNRTSVQYLGIILSGQVPTIPISLDGRTRRKCVQGRGASGAFVRAGWQRRIKYKICFRQGSCTAAETVEFCFPHDSRPHIK